MSKQMLRVSLSELKNFRVICKMCGTGVVEVPLDNLHRALDEVNNCRFCRGHVLANMQGNPLSQLRQVLDALARVSSTMDVEVEIPMPGTDERPT